MTIKQLLGISQKDLNDYIKSAYRIGINPLPSLRKRFPNIDIRFTSSAYMKYCADREYEGTPYLLVVKDDEKGILEVRLEKYYFPKKEKLLEYTVIDFPKDLEY